MSDLTANHSASSGARWAALPKLVATIDYIVDLIHVTRDISWNDMPSERSLRAIGVDGKTAKRLIRSAAQGL